MYQLNKCSGIEIVVDQCCCLYVVCFLFVWFRRPGNTVHCIFWSRKPGNNKKSGQKCCPKDKRYFGEVISSQIFVDPLHPVQKSGDRVRPYLEIKGGSTWSADLSTEFETKTCPWSARLTSSGQPICLITYFHVYLHYWWSFSYFLGVSSLILMAFLDFLMCSFYALNCFRSLSYVLRRFPTAFYAA